MTTFVALVAFTVSVAELPWSIVVGDAEMATVGAAGGVVDVVVVPVPQDVRPASAREVIEISAANREKFAGDFRIASFPFPLGLMLGGMARGSIEPFRADEGVAKIARFTIDAPQRSAALGLGGTGFGSVVWMVEALGRLLPKWSRWA
jgi:hypothetical protein